MLLFSSYLKKNKISVATLTESKKKYHLQTWISGLQESLRPTIHTFPELSRKLATAFSQYYQTALDEAWAEEEIPQKVKTLDKVTDYLYRQLIHYTQLNSKKRPIQPSIPYPYPRQHPGVSICAYVVTSDAFQKEFFDDKIWEAHDTLHAKSKRLNVKDMIREIKKSLLSSPLSQGSKDLILARCKKRQFHAEDYWFSVKLNELLVLLKERRADFPKKPMADELWLHQLYSLPRLEFMMTSSSCEDCQTLFTDLRHILTQEKICLPILIFANSPYNTHELETSPIFLVTFDAQYRMTGMTAKLPYYLSRADNISSTALINGIFTREEQAFSNLENMMNTAMPRVVAASKTIKDRFITRFYELFYDEGTLNYTTYFWFNHFLRRLPKDFMPWVDHGRESDEELMLSIRELKETYDGAIISNNESFKRAKLIAENDVYATYHHAPLCTIKITKDPSNPLATPSILERSAALYLEDEQDKVDAAIKNELEYFFEHDFKPSSRGI